MVTVHGFRGSWFTENPPAMPARHKSGGPARSTAGGLRAGLNRLYLCSKRYWAEVLSELYVAVDQQYIMKAEFRDMYDHACLCWSHGRQAGRIFI
jgi:hypothetical protein